MKSKLLILTLLTSLANIGVNAQENNDKLLHKPNSGKLSQVSQRSQVTLREENDSRSASKTDTKEKKLSTLEKLANSVKQRDQLLEKYLNNLGEKRESIKLLKENVTQKSNDLQEMQEKMTEKSTEFANLKKNFDSLEQNYFTLLNVISFALTNSVSDDVSLAEKKVVDHFNKLSNKECGNDVIEVIIKNEVKTINVDEKVLSDVFRSKTLPQENTTEELEELVKSINSTNLETYKKDLKKEEKNTDRKEKKEKLNDSLTDDSFKEDKDLEKYNQALESSEEDNQQH